MVAIAPVPSNELARLDALYTYHVLDTPADERFDLFTRICTWIFDVPIAAINFVDAEKTFFKSIIGFPAYQPGRATSMCAHAVGLGEPLMEIENLAEDARFADHPLVAKGLRFYAGALIYASCGHILGTLCMCDTRPRSLDPQQRQQLLELAKGAGAVLELHRSNLRLLEIASEDTLTGLCNRRLFMEKLQNAMQHARADSPCVLLCLDLDGFKQINDRFGHGAGDMLLQKVALRLTNAVRAGDVVARLGGDEFAILLHRTSTTRCAEELSQRLLGVLSECYEIENTPMSIGCSIGIAACSTGGAAAEVASLMRAADHALYEAKQSGRGCYRVCREVTATPRLMTI